MSLAVWGPVAFLWLAVFLRLRERTGHASRALFLALLTCALGATINAPVIAVAVDSLSWLPPNTSQLLKHVLVLIAAHQCHEVVRGLSLPEREAEAHHRLRLGAAAVAAAVLTALFLGGPGGRTQVSNFTDAFAAAPAVAAYWLVFLCSLGLSLASIRRLAWSYRHQLAPGALRSGMTLVALGTSCGLVYVVGKCAYVVLRLAGVPAATLAPAEAWTPVPLAGAVILTLAGMLWPRLANHPVIRQAVARYHYLRLHRLWRELTTAAPDVQLQAALSRGRRARPVVAAHEGELLLYRRVVEILDAELALLPYADRRLLGRAFTELHRDRTTDRRQRAVARRLALDLALRGQQDGRSPATTGAVPPPRSTTLAGDVRDLCDVDRARRPARRALRTALAQPTTVPVPAEESA